MVEEDTTIDSDTEGFVGVSSSLGLTYKLTPSC